MKTLVKTTKTKTYINFDGKVYMKSNSWDDLNFQPADFSILNKQQIKTLESESGWVEIFSEHSTIEEAYQEYLNFLKECKESRKNELLVMQEKIKSERQEAWDKLANLDVIQATVPNIRTLLLHLNEQNWGSWKLPTLSIGYSANQYDCDGKIASTIKLDKPISDKEWGIENETKFKVGGKRGHLNNYRPL